MVCRSSTFTVGGGGGGGGGGHYGVGSAAALWKARHVPVREVLWLVLEDEEKLVLVRRLPPPPPPPLTLTLGRLEGMTARDSGGGGGGGTRDWYEYILTEGELQTDVEPSRL